MVLGQVASLGALAYGAWLCLTVAGRYDADAAKADEIASRSARARAEGDRVILIEALHRQHAPSSTPEPAAEADAANYPATAPR
jgi:hypothetical protein